MPHTPHASVAARKPLPSGIGSLMESAHDSRALSQAASQAASNGASSEAPARPDGGPRVIEARRVLAARAQEEIAFERAAAQLRPSWASDGTAQSAIRNVPAEVSAVAQQGKAEAADTAAVDPTACDPAAIETAAIEPAAIDAAHVVVAHASTQAATVAYELAPPAPYSATGFPAIGPSARAPSADDTQALRAALYAPQRKTRLVALAGVGCLLLGGLLAVFAGGGGTDASPPKPGTASILPTHATAARTVNSVPQQPATQPNANVAATEPGARAAAAPEPERARMPGQAASVPVPKPTPAKVGVKPAPLAPAKVAIKPAPLAPANVSPGATKSALGRAPQLAAKPAPAKAAQLVAKAAQVVAKASPLAAKPAPAKASPLAAKPAPAKASPLAAKPTPGKAAGKPVLLSAKGAAAKPVVTGKAQKGAPSAKGTQPGAKTGRNPVDVLNPWAN